MAMFLLFLGGQLLTGFAEYNCEQTQHGHTAVALTDYLATGHLWEAIFENWESEFLQMDVFVLLTTLLIQKGSPESRRPGGVKELVDARVVTSTCWPRCGPQTCQAMGGWKRALRRS